MVRVGNVTLFPHKKERKASRKGQRGPVFEPKLTSYEEITLLIVCKIPFRYILHHVLPVNTVNEMGPQLPCHLALYHFNQATVQNPRTFLTFNDFLRTLMEFLIYFIVLVPECEDVPQFSA